MINRRPLIAALLLGATAASAQLGPGTYTIDPAGSGPRNYSSWGAAVAALAAGVTGPGHLTFQVASTVFNEAVRFTTIAGTNASTTITFRAVGSPAIIDCTGLPLPTSGITLTNIVAWLNFENLEIRGFSQYGINVAGGTGNFFASFCRFRRITVDGPASTSSLVMTLRVYTARDCDFEDCTFRGGGYVQHSDGAVRNSYRRCRFDGKGVAARLLYPFNSNDGDCLWENCFFYDCGPSSTGLDINVSGYGNMFWHNTVIVNTSARAVILAGCCGWSRSNSFRNNVVVNLGSGVAIMYGTASPPTPLVLDFNDLDHNVYFAPAGSACELQNGTAPGFTTGSLAQWVAYLNANPSLIPAGGGTSWDQNSFEGDPVLLSPNQPYDVRLGAQSPCLDTGTTTYVAGPWISYPATYRPTDDLDGDARPASLVDIGADEAVIKLVGAGSFQPGSTITYSLTATTDGGLPYQVANSLGGGPIPIDTRQLPLSPDGLLIVSLAGILPSVFENYFNVLNQNGEGIALLHLPPAPPLVGTTIHGAFVTISPGAPSRIRSISLPFVFAVAP